jgi:chromosomal replication initiation ATPase DnaA
MRITDIKNPMIYLGIIGDVNAEFKINGGLQMDGIVMTVANFFEIDYQTLYTKSRKWDVLKYRQIAIYLMCKNKIPHKTIAKHFGMERTNVAWSRDAVKNMADTDSTYAINLKKLEFRTLSAN